MNKTKPVGKSNFKRFQAYLKTIDRSWLKTWIFIYAGFLLLDAFSHIRFDNTTVLHTFELFGRAIVIPVVYSGTFIGTTILKYAGILFNFIYAHKKFPDDHLLQIALAFTLLADTILCLDTTSVYGILVFAIAQYFHMVRLSFDNAKLFLIYIITIAAALFFGLLLHIPAIYVVAGCYAALLFTNLVLSRRWFKSTKALLKSRSRVNDRKIVASTCAYTGFILFVCCDLCVATSFLGTLGLVSPLVFSLANYFSWFFYYPSQLLIGNSSEKATFPRQLPKKSENFAQK